MTEKPDTPPIEAELALMLTRWPLVHPEREYSYAEVDMVAAIHRLVAEVRRLRAPTWQQLQAGDVAMIEAERAFVMTTSEMTYAQTYAILGRMISTLAKFHGRGEREDFEQTPSGVHREGCSDAECGGCA